jgi:hypothetical protein
MSILFLRQLAVQYVFKKDMILPSAEAKCKFFCKTHNEGEMQAQ